MQIAINTRFLLPDRLEGIGWFTHEVARRLVARRPNDEFIFFFDRPFDERFVFAENVKPVVAFPPARHPLLWYAWFEGALPILLKKYRADVFLSPDGYCSLRAKTPTVMVTHDLAHIHYPGQIPKSVAWYYQYFVPRYIQRAEQIITVSEFVKSDIQLQYGTSPKKIDVACNGIRAGFEPLDDLAKLDVRAQYADGQPYFFYVGAVHPRKNLKGLIEAYNLARQWMDTPLKLLIGGRLAWQSQEVIQAHASSPFKDDIQFLGFIPEQDLSRLLGGAIALVYISFSEGFGVPLLEAMHTETPIITSNISSLPEVAGPAAICVDPNDTTQIATAMRDVHQQEHLATALIEAGRQQRQKFSWEHATDVIDEALAKLSTVH